MVQQNSTQADQSMPCNSMPCKGSLSDCLQICMGTCTPVVIANLSSASTTPAIVHWIAWWPQAVVGVGLFKLVPLFVVLGDQMFSPGARD